jgi:hypothetical protein
MQLHGSAPAESWPPAPQGVRERAKVQSIRAIICITKLSPLVYKNEKCSNEKHQPPMKNMDESKEIICWNII